MTKYNDGNWHRWNGPKHVRPEGLHPETIIEQVWHDEHSKKSGIATATVGSRAWGQTLKFRVVKEHKEPREYWVFGGPAFESLYWAEQYRHEWEEGQEIIHVKEVIK
jgi:hypothetical protein